MNMHLDLSFAYANARVKGMKSHLLSDSVMKQMLEVTSVAQVIELLEESPAYKNSFVTLSAKYSGLELVSKALHHNFVSTLRQIDEILPPRARVDFQIITGELEVLDLKTIIVKKILGQPIGEEELFLATKETRELASHLIAAKDVEEVFHILRKSKYESVFTPHLLLEYSKTKNYRIFVDALNKFLYSELTFVMQSTDDVLVKYLLSSRIDFLNILLVMRMKKQGFSNEQILPHLANGISRSVKRLLDLSFEEGVKELNNSFSLELPENASVVKLEVALEKQFVEKSLKAFRMSVLSFGTILGYYYLKTIELNNIQKIVFGTHFGVKDELKQMVYAINA